MKLFSILILIASLSFAQTITKKEIELNGKRVVVSSYVKGGINYIPLNQISSLLKYNSFKNEATRKVELKSEFKNFKFSANNPYIIVTDRSNNATEVIQLPVSIIQIGSELYIPFEYAAEILTAKQNIELSIVETGSPSPFVVDATTPNLEVLEKPTHEPKSTLVNDIVISSVTVDEKANGTLVKFKANKNIPSASVRHSIKNDVITINLKNTSVDETEISVERKNSVIKQIKGQNDERESKIEISLTKDYTTYELIQDAKSQDILVTIRSKSFVAQSEKKSAKKDKWNFDVVVLDPGHGGKDFGAIGVNNIIEKEINLAISLKLGNLIKKNMPDLKVVYTRSDDRFVELYKRGKIANESNGKLFISIHCNSAPKKNSTPNGFEVYLLRPGRTSEAIGIAEFENSVIKLEDNPDRYQKLTDENFILVSMAHSSYMKYSEKFADLTIKQFEKNLNLASRGVKQAGFYVLVGASMPSVLVETGYLSNPKDAAYLRSDKGQNEIAQSIFNALKTFKSYYDQVIDVE